MWFDVRGLEVPCDQEQLVQYFRVSLDVCPRSGFKFNAKIVTKLIVKRKYIQLLATYELTRKVITVKNAYL